MIGDPILSNRKVSAFKETGRLTVCHSLNHLRVTSRVKLGDTLEVTLKMTTRSTLCGFYINLPLIDSGS